MSKSKSRSKSRSKRTIRKKSRSRKGSSSSNIFYLKKLHSGEKKYSVTHGNKTIKFGQKGASDYTIHKDRERMQRYVMRHGGRSSNSKSSSKENWSKSGVMTPGFWSRWLLWNKPSFSASLSDIKRRFNIKVKVVR